MNCPKCGSSNLSFGDNVFASDYSYADVIANCNDCEAEFNVYYEVKEITIDDLPKEKENSHVKE